MIKKGVGMGETSLTYNPSIDNEIINALKGFSIVESVIKAGNTLVLRVANEQWIKLDKVQKKIFTKTVHAFVNANLTVEDIYIKNLQGKILACLQNAEPNNNYMAVADTMAEKTETENKHEAAFDLEKALSAEDVHLQNMSAVYAESMEKSVSDFTHKDDIPDITVKEVAPEPTPQPELNENSKYGVRYKILNVFLVVVIAGAAGYYFLFKEPEHTKRSFVLPQKIAPFRIPQAQTDKKNKILKPTVQAQKTADGRQPELDKKDASQPMAEPAALSASQTTAQPAHKAGTPSPAIKENMPAEPAQVVALIEEKQAQPPAEEKKVIAPPQQKAAINVTMYCVNVASCKLKESADAVIKDLQKKGYEPAVDTLTVKDTTWYRVTLGYFQTQGEAKNYAREFQSKENIKGYVVKKK